MTMRRILVCMLAVGLAAASVRTAAGAGFTDPKCASAKQKAAGKKEAAKLGCYAKAATSPPLDGGCISKAETGFSAAFGKADAKGACTGDATTTENGVDGCVSKIVEDIPVPTGSDGKCPAAKRKASGKAAAAELGCWAKATGKGGFCSVTAKQKCERDADCAPPTCTACVSGETCNQTPVDQACLDKASLNLSTAFTKAESKGACPGTAAGVGADIDAQCVTPIKNGLPGLPPGCGNHVIEPGLGATCDHGNTADGDSCPKTCHVDACTVTGTTLATSVTYAGPSGVTIAGLSIFVDYPEGKVGTPVFSSAFGVSNTVDDLGYGFNDQALKTTGLPTSFVHANYKTCQGAPAAVASDFACTVTDASDTSGAVVPANQVTCTVTIP